MRLARADGIGPATYRRLMQRYGTATAAIEALPELYRAAAARMPRLITAGTARREFDRADAMDATILFAGEAAYPPLLGLLIDAPPIIAVLGNPALLAQRCVAIVGARNASAGGREIGETLAEALAGQGFAVASGLARGIDTAAHTGALRSGVTLAAIAGGLDKPYPPENTGLQARIAQSGAVLTEAPFGTAPQARHFPRRNRLIAGLALGVVVIEAARQSGTLITARLALENGRDLFAVPGSPLEPRCLGSNNLIRQGAILTESIDDILANLTAHPFAAGLQRDPLFSRGVLTHMAEPSHDWSGHIGTGDEQTRLRAEVAGLLSHTPVAVDDLVARCQVSPAAINVILLEMELAGRVGFLPGQRVAMLKPGSDTTFRDQAEP